MEQLPAVDKRVKRHSSVFPARYVMAILGFFGIFSVYAMRVNLSVALVAMVHVENETQLDEVACLGLISNLPNHTANVKHQNEFNWDAETQSYILGAFFYGYVITQIPGGIAAEYIGGKWLFGVGVLVTSIFTILTPLAAKAGASYLIAVRVIEGLAEGVTFPAISTMIGVWVPKMERSRISTLVFVGRPLGTVVAMALSGVIAGSETLGGWPTIFYSFGIFGCIWFVFWAFFVFEKPEDDFRISQAELLQIQESQIIRPKGKVPWLSIFISVKVWAVSAAHFGQDWGFYTLLEEMPTYLSHILHFNIQQNGVLSALPYILQTFFAGVASVIADKMRQNSTLKITTIRKILNSIGFFSPGICLLIIAFVGCKPIVIIVLLCLAMGLNGFMYSGYNVTHVDLSPEFAGTVMGITNCVGNFSGFLAPFVAGKFISKGQTLHNWGWIFIISSFIYLLTAIVYNVFGSAEQQSWNTGDSNQTGNVNIENSEMRESPLTPRATFRWPFRSKLIINVIKSVQHKGL